MTRRKFIYTLTQAGSVVVAGVFTFVRKATAQKAKLRKFVRAIPMRRYPGCVRPPQNILEQSKWSG